MSKKKSSMPKKYKLYLYGFWFIFFSGIIGLTGMFYAASQGYLGEMPDFRQLENPNTNLATQIISSDNKVLGKFHFGENRIPVQFDDLPKNLVDALISTEDERFYSHSGIDFKATLRAIVFLGKEVGQALSLNNLPGNFLLELDPKIFLKLFLKNLKNMLLLLGLERQYTKHEIISMYLNIYDFGYNGDGIKSASSIYFDKELG